MESRRLRIVFMGTPDFAVTPLRRLVELGYNVVAVVTAPDRAAGRGLKLQESAVKRYAVEVGLRVMQPERLQAPDFVSQFQELQADLGIVIAFRMLPEIIWAAPRLGTFNLHASLLPQYRGAAPINWAVINGDKRSGVTTFMLDKEIDTGRIIGQRSAEIGDNDTAGELHDRLMLVGTELVIESVEQIASGRANPVEQPFSDEIVLKPAPKIFKQDCMIDWSDDASKIYNLIRGLSPYPTAWTQMIDEEMDESMAVKIFVAHLQKEQHNHPFGTILSDGKTHLKVASNGGYIHIDELQMEGKRRMSSADFLRGIQNIDLYKFK